MIKNDQIPPFFIHVLVTCDGTYAKYINVTIKDKHSIIEFKF